MDWEQDPSLSSRPSSFNRNGTQWSALIEAGTSWQVVWCFYQP